MKILYAVRIPKKYVKKQFHNDWYFNEGFTVNSYTFYINSNLIENYYCDDIEDYIYLGMDITFDDEFTAHRTLKSACRMGRNAKDDIEEFKYMKGEVDINFEEILKSKAFRNILKRRYKKLKFKPKYYRLPVLPRDY